MAHGLYALLAEYLLSLHEEWADALHHYETNGIAIKSSHAKYQSGQLKDFLAVCKEKRARIAFGNKGSWKQGVRNKGSSLAFTHYSILSCRVIR
jgi:hypothetical protein